MVMMIKNSLLNNSVGFADIDHVAKTRVNQNINVFRKAVLYRSSEVTVVIW